MRRVICIICLLLLLINVSSCREIVNDRRVEKLHAEILQLHKENFKLQETITHQEAEIKNLKSEVELYKRKTN